jgi:phospholipase C
MVPANTHENYETSTIIYRCSEARRCDCDGLAMFVGPTGITLAHQPNHERQKSEHAVRRLQHIIVIYQENWSFDSL